MSSARGVTWKLIAKLAAKVRGMALCRPLLLAVDGLVSYVSAFRAAFRSPLPRHGQPGRPQLVAWSDIAIVQVVKHRTAAGLDIVRRIVQGSAPAVTQLLTRSQGGGVINTAYIERLNATFRQRLACLARRTRSLAQQQATLTAGMYGWVVSTTSVMNMKACVCASGLRNDAIAGCNGPQRWRPS